MRTNKKTLKYFFKLFKKNGSDKRFDIPGYLMSNPGLKHIGEQIFGYLDLKTVAKCRLVSKQWSQFLEKLWIIKGIWTMSSNCKIEENTRRALKIFEKQATVWELKKIRQILKEFSRLNNLYETKLSMIHLAVKHGCVKFMRIVLQQGIDYYFPNGQGDTLLHIALENQELPMLKLLLKSYSGSENHPDIIDSPDSQHWPILHHAIVKEMLNPTENLELAMHLNLGVCSGPYGAQYFGTPLMIACQKGHVEIVRLLLELSKVRHIELNAADINGNTALHYACSTPRNEKVVQVLLDNAINEKEIFVMAVNKEGQTILHAAYKSYSKNQATIKLLLEKAEDIGLDLEHKDIYGRTYKGVPEYFYSRT